MSPTFRLRPVIIWGSLVLILVIAAGVGGWILKPCDKKHVPDMVVVLRANSRGVGYMEQYDYEKATEAFEEVVQMDPEWVPGRINLGIALLNNGGQHDTNRAISPNIERATALFEQILKEEPEGSWALPYAHYCLGMILMDQGKPQNALPHFRAVTEEDPNDAYGWLRLGMTLPDMSEESLQCLERAHHLNPYMNAVINNLAMKMRFHDKKKARLLFDELNALIAANWGISTEMKYSDMGRYAEVIGRPPGMVPPVRTGPIPLFQAKPGQIRLASGTRWAKAADFGTDENGELRRRIRDRFGATMVVLDYNRDGKPDLFLLGAVVENGQVRDLLLRNDGGGRFTDVTKEAGLAQPRLSLGCCVADFDNNGYPDLFITGIGRQWLFRNTGKQTSSSNSTRFEDVTAEAGLDKLNTVCLGASFVDLDQDGDLDLVVAQYAATAKEALALLQGEKSARGAGLAVFLNVGQAPAVSKSVDPPPLKPRFRRAKEPAALLGPAVPAVGLAVADLDIDKDLDLLVLADQQAPVMVLNDRLLRFHRAVLPDTLAAKGLWNGALVLDANRDHRSDLLLVGPGQRPLLLVHQAAAPTEDAARWFTEGAVKSPPLLQAHAVDIDLDGWTDVVGLSEQHKPVLLHNRGGKLVQAEEGLGPDKAWPGDLVAIAVADFDGDGFPDFMVWSETKGLQLHLNQKNGNHGLKLAFKGHRRVEPRGYIVRCNAEGFGVWASAQARDQWTDAEFTTLSAGLGQSLQPLILGLGTTAQADVVRLRWPDNTWQAEFNVPANSLYGLEEANRKVTSCPILFTWNGRRFGFVTDFLGAGSIGESEPDGGHRPPRPEESVTIEADQLVPLNGEYVLKLAEPMSEVTYLDQLQLLVLDHPADVRVYADERFVTAGLPPSQDLLAFRQEIYPVRARDHHGRDVTRTLRAWDRDTVSDFARRSWIGFAEDHWVELDFGDRLARFGPRERLILCLAGWTDYPYPESIWAASQAGIAMQPPVLERLGNDGKWQTIGEIGFPAGLPRMMTVDVTGKLAGPRCTLRLRTNLAIYWDQIFVAPLVQRLPQAAIGKNGKSSRIMHVTRLEVASATLSARGCMQEYSPDGRQPTIYDYDRLEAVPLAGLSGQLTRRGDVTELLRARDDRFVIFGPGDEVTVRFGARQLPALPARWKRSFVLHTWGYCKDSGPFTATGDTIGPLPFKAMSNYPYGPKEHYPHDALHDDYQRRYNTRQTGPGWAEKSK